VSPAKLHDKKLRVAAVGLRCSAKINIERLVGTA